MTTQDRAITTSAVNPAVAAAMEVYERLQVVRNVLAPDLNDQELSLFAMVAQRSGLDPFARQVYAVKRAGRVTFQTGIDGYRATAERTNEYGGSDEPEFGDITNGHPEWARVTVYRLKGALRIPQTATAYWDEFHPGGNQPMWQKMPRNQLAKCAEALALRKAFPYVLADVYTDTEMEQAGNAENAAVVQAAAQSTPRARLAARKAALAPAEPDEDDAAAEAFEQATEAVYRDESPTTHGVAASPSAAPAPPAGRGSPSPRPAKSSAPEEPSEPEGWFDVSAVEQARSGKR